VDDNEQGDIVIFSMTGFGKSEFEENGTSVTVEVVSVNGRFFDLKTKMPKTLNEYESDLRSIVQEYITRGRVTVSIFIDSPGIRAEGIGVDTELAGKYIELAGSFAERYNIENNLDIRTVFTLPDVITREENGFDGEAVWKMATKAVRPALDAHRAMRSREGETMRADMITRLETITVLIGNIGLLAPRAVEANTVRLRAKIENLVGTDTFDENRFAMEIALYADRVDITEECVRLKSHCELFSAELSTEKASGKKLSFLLQEMNREANTIASKSSDAEISQIVVQIKEELEKMREQAENME